MATEIFCKGGNFLGVNLKFSVGYGHRFQLLLIGFSNGLSELFL
jgi:hypothetical protein